VHDLVSFKHPTWEPSHDYSLGVVRKVTLPIYLCLHGEVDISLNEDSCLNQPYIGRVEFSCLQRIGALDKYKDVSLKSTQVYPWTCLV